MLSSSLPANARGAEFFVAPNGDDAGQGTSDAPVQSLDRAAELVREWRADAELEEAVFVTVAPGRYEMATGLHLTEEDSGAPNSRTIYRAAPGGEVRLCGGREISNLHGLRKGDPEAALVQPAVYDQVLVADLPADLANNLGEHVDRGAHHATSPAPLELYLDDVPLKLARWPNEGWAASKPDSSPLAGNGKAAADQQSRWMREHEAFIHEFAAYDWADSYTRLDVARTPAQLAESRRFQIVNALCELDAPGEYYVCRRHHKAYVLPPTRGSHHRLTASVVDTPVSCYGTSNVTFEGFTIEAARVSGVEIVGGADVKLRRCTIRNIGNLGVCIYGGRRHTVEDCRIVDVGEGGVRVDGGDRTTLQAGEHVVARNHIERCNRRTYGYRPAVNLFGVGNVVAENKIADCAHAAVLVHGNDHRIEGNEISNACRETDDAGAIMLVGDWTERGNVVRENVIRNVQRPGARCLVGVYLDDFASGAVVEENTIVDVGRGVLVGGGRDNLIADNKIGNCRVCVQLDSRGLTWKATDVADAESPLRRALAEFGDAESAHAERYPQLATLLTDEPGAAKGNRVVGNVYEGRFLDLRDGLTDRMVDVRANQPNAGKAASVALSANDGE
ncbi:MAG: right-handed parallel beta-helix repeat-containing protein [Pirellulales bacterium]